MHNKKAALTTQEAQAPADIQVYEGKITLDQSALIGESLSSECGVG